MISLNKKTLHVGLYSDIYRPISFKRGKMVETTELYSLMPVWMILAVIQVHCCIKNQNLWCPSDRKFRYRLG